MSHFLGLAAACLPNTACFVLLASEFVYQVIGPADSASLIGPRLARLQPASIPVAGYFFCGDEIDLPRELSAMSSLFSCGYDFCHGTALIDDAGQFFGWVAIFGKGSDISGVRPSEKALIEHLGALAIRLVSMGGRYQDLSDTTTTLKFDAAFFEASDYLSGLESFAELLCADFGVWHAAFWDVQGAGGVIRQIIGFPDEEFWSLLRQRRNPGTVIEDMDPAAAFWVQPLLAGDVLILDDLRAAELSHAFLARSIEAGAVSFVALPLFRDDRCLYLSMLFRTPLLDMAGLVRSLQSWFCRIEQNLRQKMLEDRLDLLEKLIKTIDSPIVVSAYSCNRPHETVTILVNAAMERVTGYPAPALVGTDTRMLIAHPDNADFIRNLEPKLEQGVGFKGMGWHRGRGRGFYQAEITMFAPHDTAGRIRYLATSHRDVTAEIKNLREVEESRHALRQALFQRSVILDTIPMRIAVVDRLGKLIFVNRSWQNFAQSSGLPEEFSRIGATQEMLEEAAAAIGGDVGNIAKAVRDVLSGEMPTIDAEIKYNLAEGPRWFRSIVVPVPGKNAIDGAVIMAVDITATREADRAIIEARNAAEEANRLKSQILANTSHELRTPLNAVIGFSELMATQAFGELNERYLEYLGYINGSGRHLLEVINDLLDLSKIESGKVELRIEQIRLIDLVNECLNALHIRMIDAKLSCTITVPATLGFTCDRLRMKQILLNIIGNAVKFTPEGGAILIHAEEKERGALIEISDNGIGMTQESVRLALQPFVQIERDGVHAEGTGLGLPLVDRLVTLHGGRLEIESAPGQGTMVRVTMPGTLNIRAI